MKRKSSKNVLASCRPSPEVLALIGQESRRKGANTLTSRQIDRVIKAVRARKTEALMSWGQSSLPSNYQRRIEELK